MKDLVQSALDAARRAGATYADARAVEVRRELLVGREGAVHADLREEQGIAVRARQAAAWGFCTVASRDPKAAAQAGREAAEAASALAMLAPKGARLGPATQGSARYRTNVLRDPLRVSSAEKVELVRQAMLAALRFKAVRSARCRLWVIREHAWLGTSAGWRSERELSLVGAGIRVVAAAPRGRVVRTAPALGGAVWAGGWEVLQRLDLVALARRAADEAAQMARTKPAPAGRRDVVLGPWLVARLLHETLAHPLTSPTNTPGPGLRVGSDLLTLSLDPLIEGAAGTIGVDDEGVAPRPLTLVHRGRVAASVYDRADAGAAGMRATGAARSSSLSEPPRARLTNLSLAPGSGDLDALLAGVDGLYLEGTRGYSASLDGSRFVVSPEVAWEVKAGKRTRLARPPLLGGARLDFWKACDAVGGAEASTVGGLWCTEGGGRVAVGHRASPVRLRGATLEAEQ